MTIQTETFSLKILTPQGKLEYSMRQSLREYLNGCPILAPPVTIADNPVA